MKMTKQQWMIIGIVVALIAIWYFFMRKKDVKKAESGYTAVPALDTVWNRTERFPNTESSYRAPRPTVKGNEFVCPRGWKVQLHPLACIPGGFM